MHYNGDVLRGYVDTASCVSANSKTEYGMLVFSEMS